MTSKITNSSNKKAFSSLLRRQLCIVLYNRFSTLIKLWPSFKRNSFRTGESQKNPKNTEYKTIELPAEEARLFLVQYLLFINLNCLCSVYCVDTNAVGTNAVGTQRKHSMQFHCSAD